MGCSASINITSNAQSKVIKVKPLKSPREESNPSLTTNCIENSVLVWLTDQPSHKIADYNTQLHRAISALKIFYNTDTCYTFLKSIEEEIIFLIISMKDEEFIKRTRELPHIYRTYIFDLTRRTNVNDTHDQSSKIQIFRNINALCDQLTNDRELAELDSLSVVTINPSAPSGKSTKRIAAFLIGQYLRVLVIRYKFEPNAKSLFADFCRTHYADDKERLNEVDDYDKTYRPKEVLKWFTKTCFVSRVINRVQRIPEIDLMYKTGFMMKQMHIILVNFYDNMRSLFGLTSLALYRGKTMSQDEFNNFTEDINDSFLSSAAFLVANTNKKLTIDTLCRIVTYHPERIAILFEIHINPSTDTKAPFALLESRSHNIQSQCDEFCFTIGTIFRVESIQKNNDFSIEIWIVKLVVADDSDPQISHILKRVRGEDALTSPVLFFIKLSTDAGYLRRVERNFFQLLQDKSILDQPRRLGRIYCALADLLVMKNELYEASDYYAKALNSCLSVLKPDHPDLIPIYTSLGNCYSKINKYALALENYKKAAELMEQNSIQSIDQDTMNTLNSRIAEIKKLLESN